LNTISVKDLAALGEASALRVDVRSASEYASGHIPGATNIPLEQIEKRVVDLCTDRPIALICQKGQRARIAATLLEPCGMNLLVVEGGTQSWDDAGLPLVASVRARWSLERQVRFAAGLLVATGSLLAALIGPSWLVLPGFIGCGLTFAGATDICPMGMLLSRLPWNHSSRCEISGSSMTARGRA
jgi:rhodanese-related sulfurtransferase